MSVAGTTGAAPPALDPEPALAKSPAASSARPFADAGCWRSFARDHWPMAVVLVLFAVAAAIVPTLANVATTDDWAYARSAQILVHEGKPRIFPVVAATAVFPVVWGAAFGLVFEPALGVFRLSTVVITALGGIALYVLGRDLGVGRARGALGVAAFLFNPLAFVLAFSFMTDPFFAALMVMATLWYARGLEDDPAGRRAAVVGSAFAALALLTRQQGVLIPLAVAGFLLLTCRLRPNRAGAAALLRIGLVPVVAGVAYLLWLRFVNDVPRVQTSFLREALADGPVGAWWLLQRLTFGELVYLGFFALPVVVAAVPATRRLASGLGPRGWLLFAGWQAILLLGLGASWAAGWRMPYFGQFFGSGGLGPPDVLGSRPRLLDGNARTALTFVCAVASLLLALVAAHATRLPSCRTRSRAGLVLAIGLGQVVGVLPPSFHYIGRGAGTLDRYLLPLVPLVICLVLWALSDVRIALPAGWLVVAAFAVFSVAGTRDYLVYLGSVWDLARAATVAGAPIDRIDAGSAWDGYHLYEASLAQPGVSRTPRQGRPWWVSFYAPITTSEYVVSRTPRPGYVPVVRRPFSSWLEREPTELYLLRRPWAPRIGPIPD